MAAISAMFRTQPSDRVINVSDDADLSTQVLQCPGCGMWHRDRQIVHKDHGANWMESMLANFERFGWRAEIYPGEWLPIGYGLAWIKFDALKAVVYPLPFNLVMRAAHAFYGWMVRGGRTIKSMNSVPRRAERAGHDRVAKADCDSSGIHTAPPVVLTTRQKIKAISDLLDG